MATPIMKIEGKILQRADKQIGQLYLYDDIAPDSYNWWSGETIKSETSEKAIKEKLSEMGAVDELELHISSNGGYVTTGLCIYSQIKDFQCNKKTAYIDGIAASIATVIAMSCNEVVMRSTSMMMIHDAWANAKGNARELRKVADDLDIITGASKTAYLEHSNEKIDEAELSDLMAKESWLTAAQCYEYGLCDRIADADKNNSDQPKQYASAVAALMQSANTSSVEKAKIKQLEDKISDLEQRLSEADAKKPIEHTEEPVKENRAKMLAAMLSGMI